MDSGYVDPASNGGSVLYYTRVTVNTNTNLTLSVAPVGEAPVAQWGPGTDLTPSVYRGFLLGGVLDNKMVTFRYRAPSAGPITISWTVSVGPYLYVYVSASPFMDTYSSYFTYALNAGGTITIATSASIYGGAGALYYIAVVAYSGAFQVFNMTITPPPLGAGGAQSTALPSATPWPSYGPGGYVLGTPRAEVDAMGMIVDIGAIPTAFSGKLSNNKWQYLSFTAAQEGSFRVTMTPYPGSVLDLYCSDVAPASATSSSFSFRWSSAREMYRQEVISVYGADPYYQTLGGNASVRYYCRVPCSAVDCTYSVSVGYLGEVAAPGYVFPGMDLPPEGVSQLIQTVDAGRFREYRYRPTTGGTWSATAANLFGSVSVWVSASPFIGSLTGYSWSGSPTATVTLGSTNYLGAGGQYYIAVSASSAATFNLSITAPTGTATEVTTATPWPSNAPYLFGSALPGLVITGTVFDMGNLPPPPRDGSVSDGLYISSYLAADQWHYLKFTNLLPGPAGYAICFTLTPFPAGNVDLYVGLSPPLTPMTSSLPVNRWSSANSYWQAEVLTIYSGQTYYAENGTYYLQVLAPKNDVRYTLRVQYIGESAPPAYGDIGTIANSDGSAGGPVTGGTFIHSVDVSAYRQYRFRAQAAGAFTFRVESLYQSVNLYISKAPFVGGISGQFSSVAVGASGFATLTVLTTSTGYQACGGVYYLAVLGTDSYPSTYNVSLTQPPTGQTCSYPTPSPVASPAPYAYATVQPPPDTVGVTDLGTVPATYASSMLSGQWRFFSFRNADVSCSAACGGPCRWASVHGRRPGREFVFESMPTATLVVCRGLTFAAV